MKTVTFHSIGDELKTVIDQVSDGSDYTIVKSPTTQDAVIMSLQYFNSLMATAYLLESPANAIHLTESIAQHKSGQTTVHGE